MKNAKERMPASRMFLKAAWIFCRSSRLTMSFRTSSDSDSIPRASIQQPERLNLWTNAGSVRLSARALPNHWIGRLRAMAALPVSQMMANSSSAIPGISSLLTR